MNGKELISKRRTKIVCTIGPASSSEVMLRRLARSGMDCARLNFSHGSHSEHLEVIERLRKISRELQKEIAIIQDLPGPKFRIGKLKKDPITLRKGSTVALATDADTSEEENKIPLRQQDLPKYVSKGAVIYLSDGTIKLRVKKTNDTEIVAKVIVGGDLLSGKGVNIPSLGKEFETFTKADRDHVIFGLANEVDFVAISFVRNAKDVQTAKEFIQKNAESDSVPWIISKIEKKEALQHLDGIIENSDGVMVARGDLGVENPIEEVPVIQKRIIFKCNLKAVPVITATQMLESMVENATPTRAEVTDVANAIFDGTDAVMLSEETAVGKYPQECVRVVHRVALNTEASITRQRPRTFDFGSDDVADVSSAAAINLARYVGTKFLLTPTENGKVAAKLARFKPKAPIIAITPSSVTSRKLKLVWGTSSFLQEEKEGAKSPEKLDRLLETSLKELRTEGIVAPKDRLVVFCDGIEFFGHEGKLVFVTEAH
jgi:pyruvate kinase